MADPQEALRVLLAGNQRWVHRRGGGKPEHPHQSIARRLEVAPHQDPLAVVFSCIDSRVPPEIVLDCGVGDLFVIRTGGQVLDDRTVLGSIEYGPVGFESCRLVLVLGHERCGAIIAAVEAIEKAAPAPGHIQAVVEALRPAYEVAVAEPGDVVENMVRAQVRLTVEALKADPLLAGLAAGPAGSGLMIVGGRYDLESGAVEIIA
jgi:carbonic anhydrase